MTAEGWALETLGRLLREPIRNGYSPNCPPDASGKWMLSLSAVTPNGFNARGVKPAPREDPRVDESLLEPGDIVVSRSNTRDRVGLAGQYMGIPRPCSYPDLLMRVRPDGSLHPAFLVCCLLSQNGREYFRRSARGTSGSMVKIDRRILEDFPVPLPPLPEQRKISAILSSVDEAIETTQAVIGQLQVVKKAMMAELLTRGIPGRHTKFKMTEIGEVPEGWTLRFIEDFAQIKTGDRDTQDRVADGAYPFIVRSQTVERIDSYSFDGEAVLTAGDGVGTGKVFHYLRGKFDYHQRVYNVHGFDPDVRGKFFFYYFSMRFIDQVRRFSAKNSVDSVRRAMIARMLVPLPPPPEQREIVDALSAVDTRLDTEIESLGGLRAIKSALSSVLLTGELRVRPDSEAT